MHDEINKLGIEQETHLFNGLSHPNRAGKGVYFCDAGCRPNPGIRIPIIWNGVKFLPMQQHQGTNHRAVYTAVQTALRDAIRKRFNQVEIRLTSSLVFRQLATGLYCRNAVLLEDRALCRALFDSIEKVYLVRVQAPFDFGDRTFDTRRSFRRYAETIAPIVPKNPVASF